MYKKICVISLISMLISSNFALASQAQNKMLESQVNIDDMVTSPKAKTVNIAFLLDGPSYKNENLLALFKNEIEKLLTSVYQINIPSGNIVVANWDLESVKQKTDILLNTDADVIITLGGISAQYLESKSLKNKKVINILSYNKNADTLSCYYYIKSLEDNIKAFSEVYPFEKVSVLINENYLKADSSLEKRIQDSVKDKEVKVIPIGNDTSLYEGLLEGSQAVYLTELFNISQDNFQVLINTINNKKLPSFTTFGKNDVQKGVLFGRKVEDVSQMLARQTALNIQSLMEGNEPVNEVMNLVQNPQIFLNINTAQKIGYNPTWSVLHTSQVLGDDTLDKQNLTLKGVVSKISDNNLELKAKVQNVAAATKAIKIAKLNYSPSLSISSGYLRFGDSFSAESNGLAPKAAANAGLNFSQLLFSDKANSQIDISKAIESLTKEEKRKLELDLEVESALCYINTLKIKTLIDTQNEYIANSKTNLKLADTRTRTGFSGMEDVYRWESELALNKRDLRDYEAKYNTCQVAINRLLNASQSNKLNLDEVRFEDDVFFTSKFNLISAINDAQKLEMVKKALIQRTIEVSPEIAQLQKTIEIKQREITANSRQKYLPSLAIRGGYNHMFDRDYPVGTNGDEKSDLGYTGLFADIPLFEGGKTIVANKKLQSELKELEFKKQNAQLELEEQVRNYVDNALASYFNIELSNKAYENASKSYKLVQARYKKGTASVTQLIDSQNTLLRASVLAKNSVYDFTTYIVWIQRALGCVNFAQADKETYLWLQNLSKEQI